MPEIHRLDGKFYLGTLLQLQIFLDDTTGHLIFVDTVSSTVIEIGADTDDVSVNLLGYGYNQLFTVNLLSNAELPEGTVVDADGAAADAVTSGGAASTATVGISTENPHIAGTVGPICTVPGSVVDILLTAAGVPGQYVATSAGGGSGTCQAPLPAVGRTIGICVENTGGAGLARCIYMRM